MLIDFSSYSLTTFSHASLSVLHPLQGKILENLRICALPRFLQCVQSLLPLKKDPNVLVIDMHFGAVPVRLLKPKDVSPKLWRGIIFYHGGAGIFGSLGKKLAFEVGRKVSFKSRIWRMFSCGLGRKS